VKLKAVEKRKSKINLEEEEIRLNRDNFAHFKIIDKKQKLPEEILKKVEILFKDKSYSKLTPQFQNLELMLLNMERYFINFQSDILEIHKLTALILYGVKPLCCYFLNPQLVGSFSYDCQHSYNPEVDIVFSHTIKNSTMKEAVEIFTRNVKYLFREFAEEILVKLKNRINDSNFVKFY
jgi:hypothetical protein